MKNTIRVTKHKGIDVGYCNCCHSKDEIYQIRIISNGFIEIRLCSDCIHKLLQQIDGIKHKK